MALPQGERVFESMPPQSERCTPNDCLRAFFCAEAVLRPQNSEIEAFLRDIQLEFPFIEFGDIHVSVDLNPDYGFKFLVADAADAIFIAFQVSQNFKDSLGSALCTLPGSGGQVDSAVFTLSHDFLGSDSSTLSELPFFRQGKRIVFCGHWFGGALAHMIVLRFWAPLYKSRDEVRKDQSQMISIAFGAPDICSSTYAEEVNGNNELKSHFFAFVHENDPTRRSSLCDEYYHDGVSNTENAGRGGSTFEVGKVVGTWNGVANCANEVVSSIRKSTTTQMKRAYNSAKLKTCQEPKFFPVGENYVLKGSEKSSASDLVSQFRRNPWSRDTFFDSYESALKLALPSNRSWPSDPNSKLNFSVTTPAPVIESAELKDMDSGRFVHVKGKNLLFLREPAKMSGLNSWETKTQTDTELIIVESPQTADVKREGNDMENALNFIVVKTAFGEASHLISEKNLSREPATGVRKLLFRIVQTFVALAIAPLCITQSSELLDDLDSIIQCVPDLKDEKLSKKLRDIANGNAGKDLVKDIMKINTTVEKVVDFLTRSYKIKYVDTLPVNLGLFFGALLLAGGLILIPTSGVFLIFSGVATMFPSGCVATGAGVASSAMAFLLSKKEILIPEYGAMLKIAIKEAQLWHDEDPPSEDLEKTEVVADLEYLLEKEVVRSGSHLTNMMIEILESGEKAQGVVFLSEILKGATLESKGNLLRRMQIVTKTLHMYDTKVKGYRFVGVVGAEDAGKSTFIRRAILHYVGKPYSELPDPELPDVGFRCHTTTVKAYKLKTQEKLYLVDFPGSNGTGAYADGWKQFTSLPSSCVLLLDFKDDIKKDQVEMYQKMKHDLGGSKVTVVFNKVDEKFTPRTEAAYNAEYFDGQRKSTAEKLGCDTDDVHFACLYPDPEDKLVKLKKVGVLGFEDLFEKVVSLV